MLKLISNLEHLFIAVLVQVLIGKLTGNWWIGAALSSGIFMGREHAQAEYRWIETVGGHRRSNLLPWSVLDIKLWDFHSWFWNLILPIITVVSIATAIQFYG